MPVLFGSLTVDKDADSTFRDPFLGLEKSRININTDISINEALQIQKKQQRERDRQLRMLKEWDAHKTPLPPPLKKHGDTQLQKVTDVVVDTFSVSVAGKVLLQDASLKLIVGHKYGLVGRNGVGKSSFLAALARGEISRATQQLTIASVEQDMPVYTTAVLDTVLAVDAERTELLKEEHQLSNSTKEPTPSTATRLQYIYTRLEQIDASGAEARASSILHGLGFTPEMQAKPVCDLSGGWRMRVALARALFADPDILLLDEPTNHLDLQAVAWLSEYVANFPHTVIIVSHARLFLNCVCTDIILFQDQKLKNYKGDYDTFEKTRAEQTRMQKRQFEAQQSKREHVQKFIDRFRYNAKRATLVQSRLKALEKLPMLEDVVSNPSLQFTFKEPEGLPTPMLQLQHVDFRYTKKQKDDTVVTGPLVLKDADLSVDLESRIAICGVNGSGKSTLLKILAGLHEPTSGNRLQHGKLRIGYFSQHHVDQLDLTLNAVQQLKAKFPNDNLSDENARTYLGGFGITGLLSLEPLYILSGGQKSRVCIALVAYTNPHILVLDEPTNHLDLEAVQALIAALNEFQGGVVVVSHDAHMLSCVVEDVWHVDPNTQTCVKTQGDFEEYLKKLLKNNEK